MTWINGRNNNSNNNNNKTLKSQSTTVSNPYNKNNIFPSLRQPKATFEGVNPMAWASPQVLKRQQAFRNQKKAVTAKVNAKRNKSLNAYKASRKNRRTRRR
jgi:hypothetical protein